MVLKSRADGAGVTIFANMKENFHRDLVPGLLRSQGDRLVKSTNAETGEGYVHCQPSAFYLFSLLIHNQTIFRKQLLQQTRFSRVNLYLSKSYYFNIFTACRYIGDFSF